MCHRTAQWCRGPAPGARGSTGRSGCPAPAMTSPWSASVPGGRAFHRMWSPDSSDQGDVALGEVVLPIAAAHGEVVHEHAGIRRSAINGAVPAHLDVACLEDLAAPAVEDHELQRRDVA